MLCSVHLQRIYISFAVTCPFVFACAWVVQRSHGAKRREHKEIINGDQYGITPVTNWVKWLSYSNRLQSNQRARNVSPEASTMFFVSSYCSWKCVSVRSQRQILVHSPAYQISFTQNHSFVTITSRQACEENKILSKWLWKTTYE